MQAAKTVAPSPTITSSVDIVDWRPEDPTFWKDQGARIANRNLWISIPSLLCGFAVWLMWGIITVQMANAGFPFAPDQLFSLAAIAGLAGATTRIPASFFIRICGGRNFNKRCTVCPSSPCKCFFTFSGSPNVSRA